MVDPVIFQVLNGWFRKSIQCNENFIITDEERIERVLSLYNGVSMFLIQTRVAFSMIVNQIIQKDRNNTLKIESPGSDTKEDDLEDIQDEKVRRSIRNLEEMYPKFTKY